MAELTSKKLNTSPNITHLPTLLPLLPSSSSSSAPSSLAGGLEFDHAPNVAVDNDQSRSGVPPAVQQVHCWSAALIAKKDAMENMLKVQKSLEEIEESIAQHLPKESIEGAHARFLSTLNPSNPDGLYLLTIGWEVTCPLSAHIRSASSASAGL
ncbi:hypothetical protein SCLCIDRAFT_26691 [Scleroderma citrinum Foug A]|uniref:Uncharacterized protein n=1 Tax=Scleroderma citrinum Foug A TaxID=1036808 RepID=A0A0C3DI12_9AGAM|nr:hypothetical protein SCLCIDRAFT_26691 [Scleroderma citrinum Foug A]